VSVCGTILHCLGKEMMSIAMRLRARPGALRTVAFVLSGNVPPLADPYFARNETGPDLVAGLRPGQVTVLTDGEPTVAAPAGQGGTGKTQLAVEFAHAVWNTGAVEVLVWATAADRESLVTSFGQAAVAVGATDPADAGEVAAANFVTWLAGTRRPWVLVVDDLGQAADLDGLWPTGPAGQTVITTRLPGSALGGPGRDPRIIPVGGFSRRESLDYLNARLNAYPDQRIEALDLAEDLNGLPLALAQAAAVMVTREQDCRQYRAQLADRRNHMAARPVDGVSAAVLATWSIACECAHELAPPGLAWPALALAAMLDENGVPGAVLTSPTACGYVTGHPSTAGGADQNIVRRAIGNLAKVGLVTIDPATPVRTVRMHSTTRTAVRSYIPASELEQVIVAAADALVETWPIGAASGPQLDQAMRDCTTALRLLDSGPLWKPEAHPVLFRAGVSLDDGGLADSAITYWHAMVATSTRLLGPAHADAVTARDRLASAYESAGRGGDSVVVFASALADRERNLGPDHPDTIAARGRLGHAYASAGRPEAVATYERAVADSDRVLGPGHPATLSVRAALSEAYLATGRTNDAIRSCQMLVTDAERLLGASDPTTLAAQTGLAGAYQAAGQPKEALEQYRSVLLAQETTRGRDHPDTIAARANLASALRQAGKNKDAIGQYERVVADRERVMGADHLDTIAARANLAFAYRGAGQLREAIRTYDRTLADRERMQGADHQATRTLRTQLGAACQQAGRLADAIAHFERALADAERVRGVADIETLTDRCSLAAALFSAGRLTEVVTQLQRAQADCERYLGPDHPLTRTVRENLRAATQA
jgi:tetratricopeptide (TPR) repeat protein